MSQNNKAPHILNASSNLVGLCFVVLTSLKFLKVSEQTMIDNITAFSFFFFVVSCLLSFMSIRTAGQRSASYERVAEYFFLGGLILVFATSMLIVFKIVD